jgi:hypothetical protein
MAAPQVEVIAAPSRHAQELEVGGVASNAGGARSGRRAAAKAEEAPTTTPTSAASSKATPAPTPVAPATATASKAAATPAAATPAAAAAAAAAKAKGDQAAPAAAPPGTPLERFRALLMTPVQVPPPSFVLYWDDLSSRNVRFNSSANTKARMRLVALKAAAAVKYNTFVTEIFPALDLQINSSGARNTYNAKDITISPARFLWLVADDSKSYDNDMVAWMRTLPKPVTVAQQAFVSFIEDLEKIEEKTAELHRVRYLLTDAYAAFEELLSSRQTSVDNQRAIARFLDSIGIEKPDV